MFRIRASYADQLELRTTIERAREFFGELRNFADLMPGIEGIRKEAGGIMRWMVRAEVPVIGPVHATFTVEKTEDSPDRLEWSPARTEVKNYLRYAAAFEERGHKVLIRIAQHVEIRRQHARDLHRFAILLGESAMSADMQKRVREMIKTFWPALRKDSKAKPYLNQNPRWIQRRKSIHRLHRFLFGFRNADFGFCGPQVCLSACSSFVVEKLGPTIAGTDTKSEIRIPKSEIKICVICGYSYLRP